MLTTLGHLAHAQVGSLQVRVRQVLQLSRRRPHPCFKREPPYHLPGRVIPLSESTQEGLSPPVPHESGASCFPGDRPHWCRRARVRSWLPRSLTSPSSPVQMGIVALCLTGPR